MRERQTRNPDGSIDDIVVTGGAQLERLDDDFWFLKLVKANGSVIVVWINGSVSFSEKGEKPGRKS